METDQTDWEYLRNMSAEEAHANALADPDAQPWTDADMLAGKIKLLVPLAFEDKIINYFRSNTPDYKTAMVKIISDYVASHPNPNL